MGLFNSGNQENNKASGIMRIAIFSFDIPSIMSYYLNEMRFFHEADQKVIDNQWGNAIVKDEIVNLEIAIETHSTGFKNIIIKNWSISKEGKKRELHQFSSYLFSGRPNDGGQPLWEFQLKDYLSPEEYLRIVGKGYQFIGSERQCEEQDKDHFMANGEDLKLWLDAASETLTLIGNHGRFKAFQRKAFNDYRLPEENVILRIHPEVKEFESKNDEYDPDAGAYYRGNENYREWRNKGRIWWTINLFDYYGVKDRKNLIKEPETEKALDSKTQS